MIGFPIGTVADRGMYGLFVMLFFRPWRDPHAAIQDWIVAPVTFSGATAEACWQAVYDEYMRWRKVDLLPVARAHMSDV